MKISLLVGGSATVGIEGVDGVEFSANDTFYLPGGNDRVLLRVSSDFGLLELEFPAMPSTSTDTSARPDMAARCGADSYRAVPGFDLAVERHLDALKFGTDGGAHAIMLRGNSPHVWGWQSLAHVSPRDPGCLPDRGDSRL